MLAIAAVVFVSLLFISAPYGRHARGGWGPGVNARTGWMVMEAPASLLMLAPLLLLPMNLVIYLFLVLWQVHYFHRAFLYPFSLKSSREMPVSVVLMAVAFNTVNAFLNGGHFVLHADWYTPDWLTSPQFIVGLLVFVLGYYGTKRCDAILAALRDEPGDDYKVPQGFLYRWVSCPNYLCESVQWFGWALMTLSPAGFVFFAWTVANLMPRAISHHRWYRETFADYPRERKAIIPYVV